MSIQVGDEVIAVVAVEEPGFDGDGFYLHASPGDVGLVVGITSDGFTVSFQRSTTDVGADDVKPVDHGASVRASQP